jgi:hypothetical protein
MLSVVFYYNLIKEIIDMSTTDIQSKIPTQQEAQQMGQSILEQM